MDDLLQALNEVDLALLGIVFLSGIFAYIRGFSWEITSLVSWALTLAAVWYLSGVASPWVDSFLVTSAGFTLPYFVIVSITGIVIFFGMTMILGPTTSFVMKGSLNMRLGFIDRFLGFCYGAVRAFVVLIGIFLVYTYFVPEQKYPTTLKEARLYITIKEATDFARSLLPIDSLNAS